MCENDTERLKVLAEERACERKIKSFHILKVLKIKPVQFLKCAKRTIAIQNARSKFQSNQLESIFKTLSKYLSSVLIQLPPRSSPHSVNGDRIIFILFVDVLVSSVTIKECQLFIEGTSNIIH